MGYVKEGNLIIFEASNDSSSGGKNGGVGGQKPGASNADATPSPNPSSPQVLFKSAFHIQNKSKKGGIYAYGL